MKTSTLGMMNNKDESQATMAHRMTGLRLDQVQLRGIHCKLCGKCILKGILTRAFGDDEDDAELEDEFRLGVAAVRLKGGFSFAGLASATRLGVFEEAISDV